MVKDHYDKLRFSAVSSDADGGRRYALDLRRFTPADTFIDVAEG